MLMLAEVGLLPLVWPPERVLVGMCVCQHLAKELLSCPSVVLTVRPGHDLPADSVLQVCYFKEEMMREEMMWMQAGRCSR